MSNDMRSLIGGLIGGVDGFVLGVVGWFAFAYVVFENPFSFFRDPGPADLPALLTGPLGAIIGAIIGGRAFRRRLRPVIIAVILSCSGILCGWFIRVFGVFK